MSKVNGILLDCHIGSKTGGRNTKCQTRHPVIYKCIFWLSSGYLLCKSRLVWRRPTLYQTATWGKGLVTCHTEVVLVECGSGQYTRGRAKVKLFDVHALCRFDVRKASFS